MQAIREGKGGVVFDVWLKPGARHDAVLGWHEGALRAEVKAPPIEGRANAALQALLADVLGVPRSAVQVVKGGKSRRKGVFVAGLTSALATLRLPAAQDATSGRGDH